MEVGKLRRQKVRSAGVMGLNSMVIGETGTARMDRGKNWYYVTERNDGRHRV